MKGIRELELLPTEEPDRIEVKAKAYEILLDQVESDWEQYPEDFNSGDESDSSEEGFLDTLRRVSRRRAKPSSPGGPTGRRYRAAGRRRAGGGTLTRNG